MKKQKETQEIEIIKQELSPIAEKALHLEINSDTTMKEAVIILSTLNQFNDNITEEKEKVTKPLNEALRAERARWKPAEKMYEEAISSIRSKMTLYQTEQVKVRKEEEEAIASRIGAGKGHLKIETAIEKIDNLEKVEKTVSTDTGTVQFRETPTLKITDITKIAREYFDLNETRLLKDLKSGKLVEGAEIEIVQTPINYR